MKAAAKVLALLAVLGFVGAAFAADANESKPTKVQGRVTKIDGAKITVTTGRGENAKETVVTTNDSTKVTLVDKDDKETEGKVADIKKDMRLQVEVKDSVATTIKASPARTRNGGGEATTKAAN